jgi:Tfp pilus assembly protein PilF
MRKINAKLFLGLLIGTAVLTGTVFAVHHFQTPRIARALLWQARHAEEQGDAVRTARYLQRYLEFNPHDDTERSHLAQVWAGDAFAGRVRVRVQAVRLLDEVLAHNGNQPELRRLLVKVALELDERKLAHEHLNKLLPEKEVLAGTGAPGQPAGKDRGLIEGLWAQLFELEKEPARAMACCRLAIQHAPQEQDNYVRLAYLLRHQQESDPGQREENYREADRALDELVAHNETTYKAYLARWQYRREFDLLDLKGDGPGRVALVQAAEDVAKALQRAPDLLLENDPEALQVLLAAADMERLQGQAAYDSTDRPVKEREKQLREHREQAYEHLDRGLALQEKQGSRAAEGARFQLLWHKANLLLDDLRRLDEARAEPAPQVSSGLRPRARGEGRDEEKSARAEEINRTIEQVRKSRVPAAADYLQARLMLQERRWAEAATLFEHSRALLATQPDLVYQANLFLGRCYEMLEEPGQMYKAYQNAAQDNADSVPALLGMAAAQWAQGQAAQAMEKYRQVMQRKAVPPRGWIDIARLEIQLQLERDDPDWKGAEQALEAAQKLNPEAVAEVALLKADMLVARDRLQEAEDQLEKARAERPGEARLWAARSDLARRRNQPERARAILDEAQARLGSPVPVLLRLARARLLADTPGAAAGQAIAALTQGLEQLPEEEQARLLTGLADAQLRANNLAEARKLWQRVVALPRYRTDLRLKLVLFDLAQKEGDREGMDRALEEIRAVERSSGIFHRYGRALQLIWQAKQKGEPEPRQKLEEAWALLDRVLTERGAWPPVFVARAEISVLSGNRGQAVRDLQEAIKNGETSPGVIRRVAELLSQQGRDAEAQQELKRLRQSLLRHSDLGRLAATVALRQEDVARGLQLAGEAVQADTRDPKELVWLGRVHLAAHQPAEAERKFRLAAELAPGEPEPWLALVQFLAEQKRPADAGAALRQARAHLPPASSSAQTPLTLARCHESLGQFKEAQEQYEAALRAAPGQVEVVRTVAAAYLSAGRYQQAEPLLRRLAAGELGARPEDIEGARRDLAIVLASGTDYRRFQEALGLVGLKLDDRGQLARDSAQDRLDSTDARRAKARVLATQGQRQFRRRAIELFEQLDREQSLTPDDRFILALLYDAEDAWPKSREALKQLCLARTYSPQYLAQYIQGLIRQRTPTDLEEADRWLGRLAELEKQREVGPNGFASVDLRARWLEARGEGEKALELLRGHAARPDARRDAVLLVLGSLVRQQRYPEAFTLCDRLWQEGKRCPPEAVGAVSVALLRSMKPTDAQVLRVEKSLKAAIARNPRSMVLRMHLADLYDLRGRYPESEEQYRVILRRENEPNNVVALNNLAWLLALRAGDAHDAKRLIDTAINGLGRRPDLLDTRGLVHLALDQPDQAVADFKAATAEAPTPARLYHLARAHHAVRDRDSAVKALRLAKQRGLEPDALHPVEQDACRRLLEEYRLP